MNKLSNSIKLGDSFLLGNHLLLCGDSRDKDMVAELIGKHKVSPENKAENKRSTIIIK